MGKNIRLQLLASDDAISRLAPTAALQGAP